MVVEVVMNKVTLPYDPVWTALDWAKKHCPSYITNKAMDTGLWQIEYFFGDEKDAVFFSLKWL